jgi:deoxyribodipyrimidine photolyase-related protein
MSEPQLTVWIPGNQLLADHPALQEAADRTAQKNIRVLLIENRLLLNERPAHPRKKILILSAMRHYRDELKEQGCRVDYRRAPDFLSGIRAHLSGRPADRLLTMASSDYRGRRFQEQSLPAGLTIPVEVLPNTQFLVGRYDPYPEAKPDHRVVMEYFYRKMRRHFDVLLDGKGQPEGGSWNYDQKNRNTLPEGQQPPAARTFPPDETTQQVIRELADQGLIPPEQTFDLGVSRREARRALEDFLENRLALFGPYQDAMTGRSSLVYHSLLSPYLNLGLLDPLQVIRAVEQACRSRDIPIPSAEGFIRQVLGWREYMYWQYWRNMPELLESNHLGAERSLPDFFWSGETDLKCLQVSLQRALGEGYNHHIERLMVLSNFCTLAGIRPREVLDWFTANYIDAYPWVMAPNVLGMGLHADGGTIGTKPYISSANYIRKMSDYCPDCRYRADRRTGDLACPFNYLYWNFLLEHRETLSANPRMNLMLSNLRHLDSEERSAVRQESSRFLQSLEAG